MDNHKQAKVLRIASADKLSVALTAAGYDNKVWDNTVRCKGTSIVCGFHKAEFAYDWELDRPTMTLSGRSARKRAFAVDGPKFRKLLADIDTKVGAVEQRKLVARREEDLYDSAEWLVRRRLDSIALHGMDAFASSGGAITVSTRDNAGVADIQQFTDDDGLVTHIKIDVRYQLHGPDTINEAFEAAKQALVALRNLRSTDGLPLVGDGCRHPELRPEEENSD